MRIRPDNILSHSTRFHHLHTHTHTHTCLIGKWKFLIESLLQSVAQVAVFDQSVGRRCFSCDKCLILQLIVCSIYIIRRTFINKSIQSPNRSLCYVAWSRMECENRYTFWKVSPFKGPFSPFCSVINLKINCQCLG